MLHLRNDVRRRMPIPEVEQVNKFLKSFVVLLLSGVVVKQQVRNHVVDRCKICGICSDRESWYVNGDAILEFYQIRSKDEDRLTYSLCPEVVTHVSRARNEVGGRLASKTQAVEFVEVYFRVGLWK